MGLDLNKVLVGVSNHGQRKGFHMLKPGKSNTNQDTILGMTRELSDIAYNNGWLFEAQVDPTQSSGNVEFVVKPNFTLEGKPTISKTDFLNVAARNCGIAKVFIDENISNGVKEFTLAA